MGGKSTLHSAVLRDGKATSSSAFDLHSWQGLTEVLKIGKEALSDQGAYAEFRNLVLQYAQQGGDQELRRKIDSIISTFKKGGTSAPEEKSKTDDGAQVATSLKSEGASESNLDVVENIPSANQRGSQTHVSGIGMRRPSPQFNRDAIQGAQAIQSDTQPTSVPPREVPISRPDVVVPVTKEENTIPQTAETPPSSQPAFKTLDEYKVRIAEIKRLVNAHIGNPASLVGSQNVNGRAYMSALLGALKATGGGGTEGVDGAMMRLETAYETLTRENVQKKPDPTPVTISEPAPASDTQTESVSPTRTPPARETKHEEEEPTPQPHRIPLKSIPPIEVDGPHVKSFLPEHEQVEHKKKFSAQSMLASLLMDKGVEEEKPEVVHVPLAGTPIVHEPENTSRVVDTTNPIGKHALKQVARAENQVITSDNGVDPTRIMVKQTELSAPHVTQALHQLLNEWSVFKGSGLFGLGPEGAEHPLYVTLAPLSMGEVVAGRYEGANPKTSKIIKQYVDAWRHEQGVAYTINETFEHYLRRVVLRIMKRAQV